MMLSRVADNLYWMSRYLERAEHTARQVDVTLDLMPDRAAQDNQQAWRQAYASLRLTPSVAELEDTFQMTNRLTFDTSHTSSILSLINAARENARQVREHISSEMWEHINRLYLAVNRTTIDDIWEDRPHEFFQSVKEGSHQIRGITSGTMYRGEGWYFIQAGQYIERAGNIATLLRLHLPAQAATSADDLTTSQYLDAVSLLRYCTAFEAYCKVHSAEIQYSKIAEFLLLSTEFPHSVHFAVTALQNSLNTIAKLTDKPVKNAVSRTVGRLNAMLDYDHIDEVLSRDLRQYVDSITEQCTTIHNTLYQTYINYPINHILTP